MAEGSGGVGGVNPAIIRREADVQGWAVSLQYSQPSEISTAVTGGGSVTFDQYGMEANPGTTAGDTADVESLNLGTFDALDLHKFIAVIEPRAPTPLTDDAEVGFISSGVNVDNGAYLDLTTGEYHAVATTSAATLPAENECSVLIIEKDFALGETRFEQRGAVNESVTIGAVGSVAYDRVATASNGSGDGVLLAFIKEVYIGSK